MIEYNISKAGYIENSKVLRDISSRINEGEVVIITGPSGSGKTTLLLALTGVLTNLLNGWIEGKIIFNNINPLNLDEFMKIPRMIGAVLQDPDKQIAFPTPLDEIMFLLENLGYTRNEAEKIALEVLNKYGLGDKIHVHVELLSGGQKRRLTFASAIAHDPLYLFLDEPTASMDPWGIKQIRDFIIESKKKGKTIILVEHKLRYFIDLADKIQLLLDGKLFQEYNNSEFGDDMINYFEKIGVDVKSPRINTSIEKPGKTILKIKNLSIGYSRNNPLIRDIELELREGEIIVITGPNGSGKTTLLKTLLGVLPPLDGEIYYFGEKLVYHKNKLFKNIFYVPQQPDYLFLEISLEREVLELSKKTRRDPRIIIEKIPWYNKLRNMSPYNLSHGQRRWLSIVIGWAYGSKILLLDEPTTGLDYNLFKQLKQLIMDLRRQGLSFIIASHDPRVIGELADTVYYIDHVSRKLELMDKEYVVELLEKYAGVMF